MNITSQLWRVGRIFGQTFGHSVWVGALSLPAQDRAAVLAVVVGATEAAYRQALPAGKIATVAKDAMAAYRMVKTFQAATVSAVPAAPATPTSPSGHG